MKKIKKLRGYSLVEVSIVLLIIGIITTGVMKGRTLINSARLDTVVNDIRSLQFAYNQYIDSYGAIPGNDKNINADVEKGKGDGVFCSEDSNRMLNHLYAVGLIDTSDFKLPKIGNKYSIIADEKHPYVKIDGLKKEQILLLKTKLTAALGSTIDIKNDNASVSVRLD